MYSRRTEIVQSLYLTRSRSQPVFSNESRISVPIAARRFSVHPPKSSPVDGFAVPMALHLFGGWHAFDCGISRDQACKWCNEWDLCVPGLSCRFASERTLRFRWPPSANVGLDGVIYSDRVSSLRDIDILVGDFALTRSYRLPEFIVDNPEFRNLGDDPL